MRSRVLVAAGAWVVVTGVATAVSWAGVDVVTRAVAVAPDPVLPADRVADELRRAVATARPVPSGSAGTATPVADGGVPASSGPGSSGPGSSDPGSSGTGSSGTAAGGGSPASSGTGPTGGETASGGGNGAPAPAMATFGSPGGQVTVVCQDGAVSLQAASPADDYQVVVLDGGPARVAVDFVGGGSPYRVGAVCQDGQPERADGPPPAPAGGGGAGSGGGGSGAGSGASGSPAGSGAAGGSSGGAAGSSGPPPPPGPPPAGPGPTG